MTKKWASTLSGVPRYLRNAVEGRGSNKEKPYARQSQIRQNAKIHACAQGAGEYLRQDHRGPAGGRAAQDVRLSLRLRPGADVRRGLSGPADAPARRRRPREVLETQGGQTL